MSTIFTEHDGKVFLTAQATILKHDVDVASWAASHVVPHPAHRWILARYVEADNANSNRQYWALEPLLEAKGTIINTPMNVNHRSKEVVGVWSAAEMMYPNNADNPYVEALGVYWQHNNSDQYKQVERAHDTGQLFVSMECVSQTITCGGDAGCGENFKYEGPSSVNYCSHMNSRESYRIFNEPLFLGGALIMPGTKPGWKDARVKEIANLTTDEDKDDLLRQIEVAVPDASADEWERMMWAVQMNFLQNSVG